VPLKLGGARGRIFKLQASRVLLHSRDCFAWDGKEQKKVREWLTYITFVSPSSSCHCHGPSSIHRPQGARGVLAVTSRMVSWAQDNIQHMYQFYVKAPCLLLGFSTITSSVWSYCLGYKYDYTSFGHQQFHQRKISLPSNLNYTPCDHSF